MDRRLAAIFVADATGYSRLMAPYEAGTHAMPKGLVEPLPDPIMPCALALKQSTKTVLARPIGYDFP
jgi:hypothetical protein